MSKTAICGWVASVRNRRVIKLMLVMKLTMMLLTAGFLHVYATGMSQSVTFSGRDIPLRTVFSKVKEQTGFLFLYPESLMRAAKPVTIDAKALSLTAFLDEVFKTQPLAYSIKGKSVFILPVSPEKKDVLQLYADPVKGRVTDELGVPLAGASVMVKGTRMSAVTDAAGDFILDANVGDILIVTFVGHASREVKITDATTSGILVKLPKADMQLEEIVINKGYYTERKRLSTGTVSKIDSKVIEKQPVSNPMLALQGRVPGIFIEQSSGLQGSGITVKIRGKNSLQNGTNPLYIVDGVPFPSQTLSNTTSINGFYGIDGISPLYNINPGDIESIEVLKDADATAIYGSRGANGVILITTKRGSKGQTKFDVDVSSGSSRVADKLDVMDTKEYIHMRTKAFQNDGIDWKQYTPDDWQYYANVDLLVWDTSRYTNWQRELMNGHANFTNVQASVSGGKTNTQYLLSGNVQRQTTVFPGNTASGKKAILFSVSNESPDERFKSRFSANYTVSNSDFAGGDLTGLVAMLAPNSPRLYNDDGTLNWENSTWNNPLASLNSEFRYDSRNLVSNVLLSYKLLPSLVFSANAGFNDMQSVQSRTSSSDSRDPAYGLTPSNSSITVSSGSNRSWIIEPQLSWENDVTQALRISALAGGSFQHTDFEKAADVYVDFPSNALIHDPGSAGRTFVLDYSRYIYRYAAAFARLNLNYRERYLLNLTGRRDGSSRFGPGRQFANLGAVGAAWIFSDEAFVKEHFHFLSFGKLRASYGLTGNDQIGDYQYLDTYESVTGYQGTPGLLVRKLNNPVYAWETTGKLEAALEMGMLDDRIRLVAGYYNNRSSNQLVNYKLAFTTGFSSIIRNMPAKIQNTGVELELMTVNINKAVKWNTGINITIPRNKLVSFPDLKSSSYANEYEIGRSLTIQKRYNLLGVDPQTGFYTFEDMNKDGAVTDADKLYVNEIRQDFYSGISNTVSYKGFNLDVFIQFVRKNGLSPLYNGNVPGYMGNQPAGVLDGVWTGPGDRSAVIQRYTTTFDEGMNAFYQYQASNAMIVDQTYARLQNVSLSYNLPTSLMRNVRSRIFLNGQNLLTITGYKGLNPETQLNVLPPLRTIVLGAHLTF